MRATEFTKEARDHGTGHSNMMPYEDHSSQRMTNNTMPYESGRQMELPFGDEPPTGQVRLTIRKHNRSRDGQYDIITLKKVFASDKEALAYASHHGLEVVAVRKTPATRENDENGSTLGSSVANYAWESRAEKLRGRIAALETALQEKASAKLCRSPKKLGNSDQSSCVAQGLRAHTSKGKGHTDGNGHYVKGRKAKSVRYGGNVKDYS